MDNKQIESCVQRTVQGDTKAFEELYTATNQRVYFICLHFLKNEQEAKDAVQDTYLSAYKNIRQLSEPSKFNSWVERIAVNVCKQIIRKNVPIPADDETLFETLASDDELILPEKYIDDAEKRRVLLEIMQNTLSDLQYRTVILYYFGNFTAPEIAEMMDCTEGAVKNRLATARAKIKKAIEEYQKDKDDKLFVFAGVPFLAKVFDEESKTLTAPALNTAMLTGSAAAGTTVSSAAGTAVKTGGIIMSKKILIGIIAGVVAVGTAGTAIGIAVVNNNSSGGSTVSSNNSSSSDNKGSSDDNTAAPDGNTGLSGGNTEQNNAAAAAKVEELGLHNPRDPETEEVSFSYVYFGSYPQTEIAAEYNAKTKADVDPDLFAKLQSVTDWDSNNDTVIDGVKYRRCNGDYVYQMRTEYIYEDGPRLADEYDYKWFSDDDPDTYHYFRYEPVKWKVFEVNENDLLLTADSILDLCTYGDNIVKEEGPSYSSEAVYNEADSYKTSRIRSFLNGLGANDNVVKADYTNKGMLQIMFTEDERSYLTAVDTEKGGDDLLTIPSVEDYSGDLGYAHGFAKNKNAQNDRRVSYTTDFAGTNWESTMLRNDPYPDQNNKNLIISEAGREISSSYQSYTLGVLPMVRVSLSCPSLQKVGEDD